MNVDALLKKSGNTRYWLVKELDTDYKTVNKLCDNESRSIRFETLEKLTNAFHCDFNELLIHTKK